jgi:hypothetical protein
VSDLTTLVTALRDATSAATGLVSWATLTYGRPHKVFVGIDADNPPAEADYPCHSIAMLSKTAGLESPEISHKIGITCGICDSSLRTVVPAGDYAGTSVTELTIGTGLQIVTTQAGRSYIAGDRLRMEDAADGTRWMEGYVVSYATTTLALIIDATSGTGPTDDWTIDLADALIEANVVEYNGVQRIEAYRKLVETAAVSAVAALDLRVTAIDVVFSPLELFPYFLCDMELTIVDDTEFGSDMFA